MTLLLLMMMGSVARSGVKVKRAEILRGGVLGTKIFLFTLNTSTIICGESHGLVSEF